jgi:hypothetical protein
MLHGPPVLWARSHQSYERTNIFKYIFSKKYMTLREEEEEESTIYNGFRVAR